MKKQTDKKEIDKKEKRKEIRLS